ncbi:serine hydrolase domain-containing protein [Paenibacillus cymbidii]|uniref:serine hydrolase domain-containing protein n=1 Tax=Paenibacillus cymbidii TaxID=1639034 RepID=UPI00107FF249|nr:serine hydrolase domain-containing protein [Paenibacillus cymbidii]
MDEQRRSALESCINEWMARYQVPGTAVAVAEHGKPVFMRGFGYRDVENQLEVTMDTVFGLASLTKSFTCAAIMVLQEQGKLSVDDPVIRYLPEFRTPDAQMTKQIRIRHFMSHSSGIPPLPTLIFAMKRSTSADPSTQDYSGMELLRQDHGPIDTFEELMQYIGELDYKLLGAPGTEYSYSNDCYGMLSAIVERVSGMKYESYVERVVLQPANMEKTSFDVDKLKRHCEMTTLYVAKSTDGGGKTVYAAPLWWEAPAMVGTGFLRSTARDILKYLEIYRTGGLAGDRRILTEASVKQMVHPHMETAPGKFYGFGLSTYKDENGHTRFEHSGGLKAISSRMCILPEQGITGVVLANLAHVPVSAPLSAAVNSVQRIDIRTTPIKRKSFELSSVELAAYTGRYVSGESDAIEVKLEEGTLYYVGKTVRMPMKPIAERDLFILEKEDEEPMIRFIRDTAGNVNRLSNGSRQIWKE